LIAILSAAKNPSGKASRSKHGDNSDEFFALLLMNHPCFGILNAVKSSQQAGLTSIRTQKS